jgi:hypothetical protein
MAKRDPALPGTSVQELLIHQVYCIIRETAQHVCDRRPDLNVSAFEAELIRFVARDMVARHDLAMYLAGGAAKQIAAE